MITHVKVLTKLTFEPTLTAKGQPAISTGGRQNGKNLALQRTALVIACEGREWTTMLELTRQFSEWGLSVSLRDLLALEREGLIELRRPAPAEQPGHRTRIFTRTPGAP